MAGVPSKASAEEGRDADIPSAPKRPDPAIADIGVVHQRRPDTHKLPAELSAAELLTKVLGPSTALSCEWLTTTYDDLDTAFSEHLDAVVAMLQKLSEIEILRR